jgi:hypothetical protein
MKMFYLHQGILMLVLWERWLKSDGTTPRNAVFTLSGKIRARLVGQSTPQLGGRFLTFDIWSIEGSTNTDNDSDKNEYRFEIDEDSNIITMPTS